MVCLRSQRIVPAVELNNILTISLAKRNWISWHKLLYQLKTLQRSPFQNVKPQRAALRKPAVVELKVWPLDASTVLVLCVSDSHWHQLKSPTHEESRISDKKKSTIWIWEQSIILLCQIIAPSGNIKWILVTIRAESINWNYLLFELFYFFTSKNACESITTSLSIFQETLKDFFVCL